MLKACRAALVAFVIVSCAGAPAFAQSSARVSYGDWDFFKGTMNGVVETSCIAMTRGVRTELFIVFTPIAAAEPDMTFVLRNPRWEIEKRRVDFKFVFGARWWSIYGEGDGDEVNSRWADKVKFRQLVEDIASYHRFELQSEDGTSLDTFSLNGSRAATNALDRCIFEITGRPAQQRDPVKDPFAGNDPF